MLELLVELPPDVVDRGRLLARVVEPELGLAAALAVLGDARRLFEEDAQLFGLRLDDARDHALLDDRVGARAEAGAEEDVGDVAPAHVQVVDVVGGVAVALQHALDRDLGVLRPLRRPPCRGCCRRSSSTLARPDRLAVAGAVEDHVLHGLAAQVLGGGFAQHPAHGVDDVGLAAAVGTDDAHESGRAADLGGVDEGLETGELDVGEAQGVQFSV